MADKYAILYHPRTLHEQNYRYYYIPYSIIAAASCLDREVPCVLVDNNVCRCDNPADLRLPEPNNWVLVGISAMIGHQITDGMQFARFVRERSPNCKIVWGGACPTMLPDIILQEAAADYVVAGAGEIAVLELFQALASGAPIDRVAGLRYRSKGQIIGTGNRGIPGYDSLPPYRTFYDRIGVSHYIRPDEHIAPRTVNYHSSQGCAFKCAFCCEPTLWNGKWSGMTAHQIFDDLLPLVEQYNVDGIKFYDSEFFIRPSRAHDLASLIIGHGIRIRWAASIHPRNLMRMDEDEFSLLCTSGLSRLLLGAETAVKEEMLAIRKQLDRDVIMAASKRCAKAGVTASFTFVTGYPGFPHDNIDKTLTLAEELVNESPMHEAKVHFFGPYPGTPLYPLALQHGFVPPKTLIEWASYDYYYIQTPWIPEEYVQKVREFNESHYPNLVAEDMP